MLWTSSLSASKALKPLKDRHPQPRCSMPSWVVSSQARSLTLLLRKSARLRKFLKWANGVSLLVSNPNLVRRVKGRGVRGRAAARDSPRKRAREVKRPIRPRMRQKDWRIWVFHPWLEKPALSLKKVSLKAFQQAQKRWFLSKSSRKTRMSLARLLTSDRVRPSSTPQCPPATVFRRRST